MRAGWHAHELGEPGAEGAERLAAHREADLGDAQVTPSQQCHGALDAAGHDVPVGRLAVGLAELTAEVSGRHVGTPRQGLDVERLRVLTVDPVPDPAEHGKVPQLLGAGRTARHSTDRATSCHRIPAFGLATWPSPPTP